MVATLLGGATVALALAETASAQAGASRPLVVSGSTSWQLRDTLTTGSANTTFAYGAKPLAPIMGDWDGNGSRTPGTFEAGTFKLRNANSAGAADATFTFGDPRGFPVAGDWNGDGRDDVAVYRNGTWQFRYAVCGTPTTFTRSFGTGSWPFTIPVAGDWDGDGTDGIGTYAPATGTWTLRNTLPSGSGPAIAPFSFWQGSGSYPVVGDWDGDGSDTVGTKRSTTWALRDDNTAGGSTTTFDFGAANDLPLSWKSLPPVSGAALSFRTEGDPDTGAVARTTSATAGVPTPLDVDDDPATDLIGTITLSEDGTLAVVVERAPGETAALPVAVEAVVTDATRRIIPRTHLAVGYDARSNRAPGTFRLTAPLNTLHASPSEFVLDVSQESRGDTIALTAELFDGSIADRVNPRAVRLDYALSPDAATVRANADCDVAATLTTNRPGAATLTRRLVTGSDVDTATVLLQNLPSQATLSIGSRAVRFEGSAPIDFVRVVSDGLEVLPGAGRLEAEINGLPQRVSLELPATGVAQLDARGAGGVLAAVGQLRLALSDGTATLPSFVSDASYNSNPGNGAFRDRLEVDDSPTSSALVLRLTGVKSADVDLDPIALTLEHDAARARPLEIDAAFPNRIADRPPTTVTGLLNKPSARTVADIDFGPGELIRMRFENATSMGSLALSAANLGEIPQTSLALANVAPTLSVCMNADSQCRSADRLPTALPDYAAFGSNPAQSATAGGQNRPYPALVSMNFDDDGTSGSSSAISSMITMNATIKLNATDPPIQITNLRFHSLSLDLGRHPTNPSFSFLGSSVPRIYMFLDSAALPFVMNEIEYPDTIESFKIGTDGSPANGNRRLAWLPGTRCTASSFGNCLSTGLDQRTSGSLNCGGQRSLSVRMDGISINLLNHLGQQLLPMCSS